MRIQIPVIYPSTLTIEQRKIIKAMFRYYEKRITPSTLNIDSALAEGHVDAFLWLFGEDFFENAE